MTEDKPVRFGVEDWDRVTGLELCEHIELPNAYEEDPRVSSEYISSIEIHCTECNETYAITELIN